MAEDKRSYQINPKYPYHPLGECVAYIEKLYAKDKTVDVPKNVAMNHMGLDPKNDWSARATSAITGFGLLEEKGSLANKVFHWTEIGKTLVLIKDPARKKEALQEAAFKYGIFKQLYQKWPDGLPSDDSIKFELINMSFTDRAAGRFISVLRNTYDFAQLGQGAILEEEQELTDNMETSVVQSTPSLIHKSQRDLLKTINPKGYEEYTLSLSWGKEVKLLTSEALTKSDIDFMLMWIKRLDLGRAEPTQSEKLEEANKNETGRESNENN